MYTSIKYTLVRCTPVKRMFGKEAYIYKVVYAHEVHAHGVYAYKVYFMDVYMLDF
jgi:hypothetical protein